MNILKNKILVKLIASICVFLTLLSFGLTNNVYAADDEEVWGGPLLKPIVNLFTGIGDGIMDILHNAILQQDVTLIKLDSTADNWWAQHKATVWGVIAGIVVLGVVATLTFVSGGGAAAFAGIGIMKVINGVSFVIKTVVTSGPYAGLAGILVASLINGANMSEDIYLPIFKLTPEEIFADKVWLFDVNFFEDPSEKNYEIRKEEETKKEGFFKPTLNHSYTLDYTTYWSYNHDEPLFLEFDDYDIVNELIGYSPKNLHSTVSSASKNAGTIIDILYKSFNIVDAIETKINENDETTNTYTLDMKVLRINKNNKMVSAELALKQEGETKYTIWLYSAPSPALEKEYDTSLRVYKGKHIDGGLNEIISQEMIIYGTSTETKITQVETDSIAVKLNRVIASWYFILRNLALLVLMVVLIYTGIRIVIGSTAGEKAKYKERIIDWIVALCLVFILHYIMIFAIEITEKITVLIDSIDGTNGVARIIWVKNDVQKDRINNNEYGLQEYVLKPEEIDDEDMKDETFLKWATDLAGGMRLDLQSVNEGTANWIGYAMCYIILVLYTLFFAWTYLKRVLYMAFLTIMAPLVAMTYPIDKITDGKAQAFNQWLKEYIFNLLIQPFHLLLYTILVGMAYQLAAENPLYAIVAIGFMLPAEKLLRTFFGFDKAKTPGLLGGAAGAALAMTGLQKLMGHRPKESGGGNGRDGDSNTKDSDIKWASSDGVNAKEAVAKEFADVSGQPKTQEKPIFPQASTEEKTSGESDVQLKINNPTVTHKDETAGSNQQPIDSRKTLQSASFASAEENKPEKTGVRPPRKMQKKHSVPRTLLAAAGAYNRAMGKKMTRRINNAKPIRSLARGIAGAYGATALGLAGLALGVASGDPSKAFQYTTAGLTGGYSLGKGLGGKAVDTFTVDTNDIKNSMEMTWAGEEYKKRKLEEQKKNMIRNENYIKYLRKTLGVSKKGAQEILERTGSECFDSGITSIDDIAAIEQMAGEIAFAQEKEIRKQMKQMEEQIAKRAAEGNPFKEWEIQKQKERFEKEKQEIEQRARENAIAMKKFSDRTPDLRKLGKKKREDIQDQFEIEMKKEIKKQLINMGETEEKAEKEASQRATKAAETIISGVTQFDDIKTNITRA